MRSRSLTLQDKMPFGKYVNVSLLELCKDNIGYMVWMRHEKRDTPHFFAPELHALLDFAITENISLRNKYPLWNVDPGPGIDCAKEPTASAQTEEPTAQAGYSDRWGAF